MQRLPTFIQKPFLPLFKYRAPPTHTFTPSPPRPHPSRDSRHCLSVPIMFCVAGHDIQRPTHPRLHVRDARDAQIMFEACRLGLLTPVSRRLNDSERAMFIKSGSVFVWQEADDDIGLKRWTDGLMWSCSRMREPFLFYEEKTLGDQLDPNNMKRKDLVGTKHAKELPSTGLLVKQTYSAIVTLPGSPPDAKKRKWHITCYFTHEDFPHLPTLDMYPSGKSRQSARSNGDFGYTDGNSSRRTSPSPLSSPIIPNTPTTRGSSRSSSATSSPLVAHSGIQWGVDRQVLGPHGYPIDRRSYDPHVVEMSSLELPAIRPNSASLRRSDTYALRHPHDSIQPYEPRCSEDERMIRALNRMETIKIAKVNDVTLVKSGVQQQGTLHLTAHNLIFQKNDDQETWIPYSLISLVTRLPQTLTGSSPISVRCRTFENLTFYFANPQHASDVFDSVRESTVATSVTKLYAFFYTPPAGTLMAGRCSLQEKSLEEWASGLVPKLGDLLKSIKIIRFVQLILRRWSYRLESAMLLFLMPPNTGVKLVSLLCPTCIGGTFQPMVGLTNNRSVQDEKLIEAIFQSHHSAHSVYAGPPDGRSRSTSSLVYGATPVNLIIDARPTTNAMANAAKGAGTENMDNYKEARKVYLGIDNIHVMRDSLARVAEALYEADMLATMSGSNSVPSDALGPEASRLAFLDRQALRRSGWIKHLTSILEGTLIIVKTIHINASHALLHCSDGTLRGFYVLVEKEWLSFGHKFLDRCGHLSSEKLFVTAPNEGGAASHLKETSPVFHQFLESLWQIYRQFPTRFEYNEDFLLKVYYHLNSCQFGTFLFNCERERRVADGNQLSAEQRTRSAWDWFEAHRSQWLNSDYDPSSNIPTRDTTVLIPDSKDVRFWYRLYGRGNEEMNGGGITNQATASGVELRGPVVGSEDDPVLAGSPLAVLTPSATPPPSGDLGSQRAPYQPRSPTRIKRVSSGLPSTASTPPPTSSRQDSLRPFASTNSAFSMQAGGSDARDALAPSRAWRNAAEGLAAGAGGVRSVWASLSSNATAAFQAAQAAYDTSVRDYGTPNNDSSPRMREDILSNGGELPTVSKMGSLGRNSGSASVTRSAPIPDVLSNPWADQAPVSAPTTPHRLDIAAPTPIGVAELKPLVDVNQQPWARPAASPSSHAKSTQPSLVNSIGSLSSSLSDLTLLTEPNLSRSQSSASPRLPPTEPVLSNNDGHQPQSSVADIDPLGVGFR
ncbi:protein-tyrosine phosphatase family Non-receptor class myotubularin subfamily [Rhizoctonia solani]|uniref:Protein-tyrosine phosphatase family Non-receptor class myotubularin subfamily n=1 Tax=Rhizoctonia solani TaxID=456999 RepID=A0A8H7IIR4_9AGAM|nr:protein-tyrosine phosphatase family Non-receptor class myotubularin subfamily [Rhizoctonia solani]